MFLWAQKSHPCAHAVHIVCIREFDNRHISYSGSLISAAHRLCAKRSNHSIENIATVFTRTSIHTATAFYGLREYSGLTTTVGVCVCALCIEVSEVSMPQSCPNFSKRLKLVNKRGKIHIFMACCAGRAADAGSQNIQVLLTNLNFSGIRTPKALPSMAYMIAYSCESLDARTCRVAQIPAPPSTQYFR